MTKDDFIFNLKRCGCLYKDGNTYYEENELIECFENVGAFNQSSVNPQELKIGHWIPIDEEPHEDYECDKCGYIISTYTADIEPHIEYEYCPKCGAKMIESQ